MSNLPPSPYGYYQLKWRDIYRRAAAATGMPAVAASPPTMANESGTYASSTVVTSAGWNTPSILPNDPRLETFGGLIALGGDNISWLNENVMGSGSALTTGGAGWGQSLMVYFPSTNGAIDVSYNGFSGSGPIRVRVNDQLVSASAYTTPQSGYQYIKLTFATAGLYKIEFDYAFADSIAGYNITPGALCWSPSETADQTSALYFGDSYAAAENITDPLGGLPQQVAQQIGVKHMVASGLGGGGWTVPDTNYGRTFLQRIQGGDLARYGNRDLMIMQGSINDHVSSASAIESAVQAGASLAWAAHPESCFLWLCGLAGGTSEPNNATANNALIAGIQTAAGYSPTQNVIVNLMGQTPDGTLLSSMTSDNVHPNFTYPNVGGTPYLASRIRNLALPLMKAAGGC